MAELPGHVWIVGAGPGDPGLLTLAAVRALEGADVVLYDALVATPILAHARSGAELIYVGKRAGQHALEQDEIETLIVEHAQAGEAVVRLKGGDPFVYGRGGEEALACRAAGIPFTIVPGITSALAAAAYAGIPITHRGLAESFLLMTAQGSNGRAPNWVAAAAADTIVVLMGRERLPQVCSELIAAGKDAETPAACVRWGTRHDQQVVRGTLATLPKLADEAALDAPIATIVGAVVALGDDLAWFTPGPLAGKRVVVTRARDQASDLAARLSALGAHVVEAPVIQSTPRLEDHDLLRVAGDRWDWILFTSASGVRAFFAGMREWRSDARSVATTRLAAIGEATSDELERHFLRANFVPSRATGECLAHEVPIEPGETVLFPCSSLSDDSIARALRERGIEIEQVVAYDNEAQPLDEQSVREVLEADAITFTSASTARNLRASLPEGAEPLRAALISIGERTSESVREAFGRIDREASAPSLDSLIKATVEVLQ